MTKDVDRNYSMRKTILKKIIKRLELVEEQFQSWWFLHKYIVFLECLFFLGRENEGLRIMII